ncbi:enoyl-CoA hydratase/isomerase family protein [Dactylosporangium sp. CA-233914]|uniref:enoyl-CoA hydratase/isomerase family protein n=1 Tax=Dactylosporangium sp. CA-233914 TaxID=3239934 RepID=UPI003D9294EF
MNDHLIVTLDNSIGTILLNRPEKLNAMTGEMYRGIAKAVQELDDDPVCRVIVLRGAGRAFSSGGDLSSQADGWSSDPAEVLRSRVVMANSSRWAVWDSSTPVVAVVQGYCLGGGFELALPADFTLAHEDARFGEPDALFGAGPAFLLLPWVAGHKIAKEHLMLGQQFSAQRAYECGIVTRVYAGNEFEVGVDAFIADILKLSPHALAAMKAGINRSYEIAGMRTAIDTWVERAVMLPGVPDEQSALFMEGVRRGKVADAIRQRNSYHESDKA